MANVLIIDDDISMNSALSRVVKRMDHNVASAFTLNEGLQMAIAEAFDAVYLVVRLPDGNGLDILPKIRETDSSPEIIIITGAGDPDGAELAIKNGAWDYIEKPSSIKAMALPLVRALQYREEKIARCLSSAKGIRALKRGGIVGNSPRLTSCLDLLAQAASTDASVLITGETGTGKELFARAIHENSSRAEQNFIVVDCASLPETLVESVLFGHEKGSFTGADRNREGLIRQADGGTLFLDEVGELPLSVQKVFLRVLQEHRFRPVGAKYEVSSKFRLVVATNRNLDGMVEDGLFRQDLLYRLKSFVIDLPPLRERCEDIRELAMYYMAMFCERNGSGVKGFSPDLFEVLQAYPWPGNIRELVNVMERVVAVARGEPTLYSTHLPTDIRVQVARASLGKKTAGEDYLPDLKDTAFPTLKELRKAAINRIEQQYLQDLITHTGGNIEEACQLSGLQRARLYELLKSYSISLPR